MSPSDGRPPPGAPHPPQPRGEQHEAPPPRDVASRPRSEPRSLRYHDLAGARPLPAGRVLVIGALALFLAALLNADGLAETATRQSVGWKRNVARTAVEPFCTLGRVTRLKDARAAIRSAADKRSQSCDEEPGADAFDVAATTTTTPPSSSNPADPATPAPPTAPPVARRTPTAEDPLRVWLGGDSMTIELAQSVEEAVTGIPTVALTTRPEVSSGLTRPDFFDWPGYFAEEVLPADPEVMVVMFGANDSQGMDIDGQAFQPSAAEWQTEYRRRVGIIMDQLRGEGRLVLWVGQPHMRDAGFDQRMGVLDDIYAQEAEARPWVRFLDSRPVLSPDGGGYQTTGPGGVSLRQSDGIHLDRAGAAVLAEAVLAAVEEEVVDGELPR